MGKGNKFKSRENHGIMEDISLEYKTLPPVNDITRKLIINTICKPNLFHLENPSIPPQMTALSMTSLTWGS